MRRCRDRSRLRRCACRSGMSAARRRTRFAARNCSGVACGCAARSANEIARSVPATRTAPSAISISPAAASSASAASCLSWSASVFAARSTETPPTGIELEPPVPAPVAIAIGVALHDAHALRRQIEPLGDQLRIGGGVALPGRLRADQHGDAAIAIEPHVRGFRPVVAAGFDIGGDADAAQAAGALGCGGALVKAVPVGDLLRARHACRRNRRSRRSCRSASCRASPSA